MLEIDYSLVPMTEADREEVRAEVMRRVSAGEIPPPDRSVNGRLVLLNPDPVQTIHQIPDDLRPRLRRIMLPAQEGSTHLPADTLYNHIVESDERLYLIVIELQSEFRSLVAFLHTLPRLRALYPELGVFLSGTLPDLRAKLKEVLANETATLVLEFDEGQRVVEIADAETFARSITTQQQVVSFTVPFFTEIRLVLEPGGKPIPFNLLTLRKLHPYFGQGPAEEVEVGRGRRERMIVVDLPLPLIRDFRFRQDRGLDFLGVVIDGQSIQSRHFGEEKLEFRWVPLAKVQKFLRRGPTGGQEVVDMSKVGALRVNTLSGEVSFLMKDEEEKVAVEMASSIGFQFRPSDPKKDPVTVTFDRFIQPSSSSASHDPMQEAVRDHFYHKLIGEEVEHRRKQEIYSKRLNVAAVGPLAGQTLKLLRRFGLERLIDADSFHYLADTPEEVPYYRNTPNRYEEHFKNLVGVIREVAVGQPSDRVRIDDIAYNMPISTEWVDTGLASLDKVSTQELEAVYREMQLLADFIGHEFQRNFDIQQEDVEFFGKINTCREASLLAKWLGEYKRGAYGPPVPEGTRPDVLFFATDDDKKENDTRYYFPSLSCAELLNKPDNKSLFDSVDYDFSVFLEEQMALAVHMAREEGVMNPGLDEFNTYFTGKMEEGRRQEQELQEMLEAIEDANSPLYERLLKQEEQAYQERYQKFLQDRSRVEAELRDSTVRVQAAVDEVRGQLDRGNQSEAEFFRDTPDHPELLEQRILGAASRTQARLGEALDERFQALTQAIEARRAGLEQFVEALRQFLQQHQAAQSGREAAQNAALHGQVNDHSRGRLEPLRRMTAMDRDTHARRLQGQLRSYLGDLKQLRTQTATQMEKNRRAAGTLHSYLGSAGGRLESLSALSPAQAPEKVVRQATALRKLLVQIAANADAVGTRVEQMHNDAAQNLERVERAHQEIFKLRIELALVRAVEERAEPVWPTMQGAEKAPTTEEVERLQASAAQQATDMQRLHGGVKEGGQDIDEALKSLHAKAGEFKRFSERHEALIKLISRKARLRAAAKGLAERQAIMDEDLANLPQRVRELFMPARKQLLVQVFLPEAQHRTAQFGRAQGFVGELLALPHEPLQKTYLERAIYRRFQGRQFMRGGAFAGEVNSDLHFPTRNVPAALRFLERALKHNFRRHKRSGVERVQIPLLSQQDSQQILATITNLAQVVERGQFDFLVLPPTLPLTEGLRLILRKDELYEGVPRLVLIFVTKFNPQLLRRDPELRDAYFRAVKHNVVLNIDGHDVVDNPRSIGLRLMEETLGSAIDIPDVEEPPAVASAAE